jgi:hypothetical protein
MALLVERHYYNKEVPWGEPASVAERVRLWGLGVWFQVLGWFCVQRFKILKPDPLEL